jgi:hypothetical protein
VFDIGSAAGAIHVRKRPLAPPRIQRQHALLGLVLSRMAWGDVGQVDRENIGDQDFRGMTAAFPIWLVFVGKVRSERSLGARASLCNAARADLARSVSNDPPPSPAERAVDISFFGTQPETGAFCCTRHNALIFSIAASVV